MALRCKKRTIPSAYGRFRQVPVIIHLITKALLLLVFAHALRENRQFMHKFEF